MMRGAKNILALAICAFASIAHGQTYGGLTWGLDRTSSPYKVGINLNGVWYNFGQITSAGVPTPYFAGTTCAAGQFFNIVSSTGQFTCTAGSGASVATNAALAASPTANYPNGVWRTDYASGRGAPPLWFMPLTGNCAANSLVNDGGSCVNTTAGDGNSWKAVQPSGWANVLQFGATQDGVTDSTTAIQNAMNASAVVYFPKGTAFIAGNLVQTRDNTFGGDGNVSASVLKFLTGATGWLINNNGFVVTVDRLELDGGNTTDYSGTGSPGTRSGIHLSASVDGSSLRAVNVHGFNNIGVGLNGNTSANNSSVIIADSIIAKNYCGLDTEASGASNDTCLGGANGAEYITVHGNQINKNRYGVIASGNNSYTSNSIIRNGYGFTMAVVGNSGHGTLTGNLINHSTIYSLYSAGVFSGYSIVGNQLFFGNINIAGGGGQISFSGNTIAVDSTITLSGPTKFSFVNNYFYSTPTIVDTSNAPLGTIWDANYDATAQNYINNTSALLVDPLGVTASSSAATGTVDMVTNGNFAAGAASWTVGAGWAIVTEATATAANGLLSQNIAATTNTYYSVTYTVSGYVSGTIKVGIGGVNSGPNHNANGTYTDIIGTGAGANGILYLIPAALTATVDNVHVYSYSRVGAISLGQLKLSKIVYSAAANPVPTCNAGLAETVIAVSDATAPTYGGAYTSGGAVHALLFCNGTAWSTH